MRRSVDERIARRISRRFRGTSGDFAPGAVVGWDDGSRLAGHPWTAAGAVPTVPLGVRPSTPGRGSRRFPGAGRGIAGRSPIPSSGSVAGGSSIGRVGRRRNRPFTRRLPPAGGGLGRWCSRPTGGGSWTSSRWDSVSARYAGSTRVVGHSIHGFSVLGFLFTIRFDYGLSFILCLPLHVILRCTSGI